jgi:hypothetical protein
MTEVLQSVAARCDGVRCDMAMLLLADVFAKTWQDFPGSVPIAPNEFWADAIRAVKAVQPGFVFLAEAYWDLEARLQELGFDFTYDKRVYDYLVARRPWEVQRHLLNAAPEFLGASAHFLENHDEARIAASLSLAEHRAAALLVLGLPGLRLLHEGQLEGARRQARVQLQRRAVEAPDPPVTALYEQLLAALGKSSVGTGQGLLLQPTQAWADNYTARNFIIVQWQANAPEFDLVVVNLAAHDSQCYAPLRIAGLAETNWELEDRLGPEKYRRRGDDLQAQGLYLDVPAHAAQLFHFRPIG